MEKSVYDIIKKQNGEKFARVLRDKNLLEIPNLANIVKYAGNSAEDALAISAYLWGLRTFEEKETPGDPFELLHKAGYEFVEYANTLEKQNAIAKYFRDNERLCTFDDPTRYERNYIINAVKYNLDSIKPAPRGMEQRQDKYGTSVISIQIQKPTDGTNKSKKISIKNRYNHTVSNPDNTFDSNPDNIIPGLSASLKAYFNVDWVQQNVSLPNKYTLIGDQIIKYNFEINNCYIGADFYEQHGKIYEIDKNSQMMMDCFIYDNKTKKISNPTELPDGFIDALDTEIANKKITITGKAPNQSLFADDIEIVRTQNGQITYLNLPNIEEIGDDFLGWNKQLLELNLPKVKTIHNDFLFYNEQLTKLNLPNLQEIGDDFLCKNNRLIELNLLHIQKIGNFFLHYNEQLTNLNLPKLQEIGGAFLCKNTQLAQLNLPNVKEIGNFFLDNNKQLSELNLPNIQEIGNFFLESNEMLTKLNLPNVQKIGNFFLYNNEQLTESSMLKVKTIGNFFLYNNKQLIKLNLPNIETIGDGFLYHNEQPMKLNIPKLNTIGNTFLKHNKHIKTKGKNGKVIIFNNPNAKTIFAKAAQQTVNRTH